MPDDKTPATLEEVITPVAGEPGSKAAADPAPTVPAKYADKDIGAVIKMHQEAEAALGRQGTELGEVRRMADQLIQADIGKRKTAEPKADNEVKIDLDDPDETANAIRKLVDLRVEEAVASVNGKVQSLEGASIQTRLDREYPEWRTTAGDQAFKDWVDASPVRLRLAQEGNAGSYDSSAELFSTWKALNPAAAETTDAGTDPEAARKAALKTATLETGPAASSSGKTNVYLRADLQKLRQEDPDRYDALRGEIRKAYQEGRVK